MDYSEIEEYAGEKTACDNCERIFGQGKVITVDTGKGYVFCYSDSFGGCVSVHVVTVGEVIVGKTRRFGGSSVMRPENVTPNYPNMPINQKKREHFRWMRKLLDGG